MSKVVLVIDTPDNCDNCPCFQFGMDNYCAVTNNTVYDYWNKRDVNCPLKPLPEKFDIEAERNKPHDKDCDWEFESGYNVCIDEILGQ